MLAYDRRSEPRVGERVPYVIVYGIPGLPLIQLVRRPIEVLQDSNLRLNATYYITKQILPPLARILSLVGIDVFSWYHELPRVSTRNRTDRTCHGRTEMSNFCKIVITHKHVNPEEQSSAPFFFAMQISAQCADPFCLLPMSPSSPNTPM